MSAPAPDHRFFCVGQRVRFVAAAGQASTHYVARRAGRVGTVEPGGDGGAVFVWWDGRDMWRKAELVWPGWLEAVTRQGGTHLETSK